MCFMRLHRGGGGRRGGQGGGDSALSCPHRWIFHPSAAFRAMASDRTHGDRGQETGFINGFLSNVYD